MESKRVILITWFTKQRPTHRHRKQRWLPKGKGGGRDKMRNVELTYTHSVCVCVCVCARARAYAMSDSWDSIDCRPPRLLCPWDSSGKNTEVGCHFLLQGIFPTQGSNLHLLHCWWIFYCWATRKSTLIVQSLSHVQLFVTPWTTAHQAPLSSAVSRSLLKFMSFESVMLSKHLIFCRPFSCPQSFPASGSFQMCQLFASGGQSIGVSASSVLPINTQDDLLLDGLVGPSCSPRDS